MADRPEYVVCILTGHEPRRTWCGRKSPPAEWALTGATHASLNARARGRLLNCPDCARAIATALVEHSWKGEADG